MLIGPPRRGARSWTPSGEQILAAPHRWIAQEMVALSTHPVFDGTALAPRHVDLRAFVFLGEHRRGALPVALTRVAPAGQHDRQLARAAAASKDTWMLGEPTTGDATHGAGPQPGCAALGR